VGAVGRVTYPVPGQQSLGRDERGHFFQKLPTQAFGFGRQSTALVVVEPYSPAAELFAQDAVLFAKVLDD
jgi:hypothetical protein